MSIGYIFKLRIMIRIMAKTSVKEKWITKGIVRDPKAARIARGGH